MLKLRKKAVISKECVACGCCVKICPLGALSVHKGMYAPIDEEKCVVCGKCAGICPAAVISVVSIDYTEDNVYEKTLV